MWIPIFYLNNCKHNVNTYIFYLNNCKHNEPTHKKKIFESGAKRSHNLDSKFLNSYAAYSKTNCCKLG